MKVSLHSPSAILLLNGNHEKGCMIWNVKKTPTHLKRSGRLTDFRPPNDAPHSPIGGGSVLSWLVRREDRPTVLIRNPTFFF